MRQPLETISIRLTGNVAVRNFSHRLERHYVAVIQRDLKREYRLSLIMSDVLETRTATGRQMQLLLTRFDVHQLIGKTLERLQTKNL